jgi:Uma2 family endonuclease
MSTPKLLTVEDVERNPPDGEWELIDGAVVPLSPASPISARVGARLLITVGTYVDRHDLGVVYNAEAGYKLFADRETLRAPDVSFVRKDRAPRGEDEWRFARLAPDLAIEVLSPTDSRAAALRTGVMYIEAGVRLVWIVDPMRRVIVVLSPDDLPVTLAEGDTLDGGDVLPGFAAPVADVFR